MFYRMFSVLAAFCILQTAQAQFRQIPAAVTDSFKARFAGAAHVEWRDKITNFQAEFELEGEKQKAFFSGSGKWQKTEKALDFDALPATVKDGFDKSKYANDDPVDILQVDDADKGRLYRLVVKRNEITKRYLYFTPQGQLIKDDFNF